MGLSQPVVHRAIQVVGDLCNLPRSDQRTHLHEAAVARYQCGADPQLAEEQVGSVLHESGRDLPEVVDDDKPTIGSNPCR